MAANPGFTDLNDWIPSGWCRVSFSVIYQSSFRSQCVVLESELCHPRGDGRSPEHTRAWLPPRFVRSLVSIQAPRHPAGYAAVSGIGNKSLSHSLRSPRPTEPPPPLGSIPQPASMVRQDSAPFARHRLPSLHPGPRFIRYRRGFTSKGSSSGAPPLGNLFSSE
jgi:hypothetical protein